MTEQAYQNKLRKLLKGKGWHVIKLVRLGVSGYPDLQCTHPDRVTTYVEVKSDNGELSPVQSARADLLRKEGFVVHVTCPSDFDTFKTLIEF